MKIIARERHINIQDNGYFIGILLALSLIFMSPITFADDLDGWTTTGEKFSITTTIQEKKDTTDYSKNLNIVYRSGAKFPARNYVYEGQAAPTLKKGRFGIVVIGERIGGMDGTYSATYLIPVGGALNYLGGVEVSMTNGRFVRASIKQNDWNEKIGILERNKFLDMVSNHTDEFFSTTGANPIDDVLLFFAAPDLMGRILDRKRDFARVYSKMMVQKIDSSLGSMIRRSFVGNNQSLCDEEQFDIFSCRVGENVASVCLTNDSEGQLPEYRYGKSNQLDLKLLQLPKEKAKNDAGTISFFNKNYEYTVFDLGESMDASILVKKNGLLVAKKLCLLSDIEPIVFPVR
jgi:hypothetical protein